MVLRFSPIIHAVLFLVLFICFFLQIREQFEKFQQEKKTLAFSFVDRTEDVFPVLNFCPRYKPTVDKSQVMSMDNAENWQLGQTLAAMNATFRDMTFDLKNVVKNIVVRENGTYQNVSVGMDKSNPTGNGVVYAKEIYAGQGRCYAFYSEKQVNINVTLIFELFGERNSSISLNVYPTWGAEYGVVDNFWPLDSVNVALELKTEYALTFIKSQTTRITGCTKFPDITQGERQKIDCILNYTVNFMRTHVETKKGKICWIPQADYFIKEMNLASMTSCQTRDEIYLMLDALQESLPEIEKNIMVCPVPCSTVKIEVKQAATPQNKNNGTILYIGWQNSILRVEEEYLLIDWLTLVSNVGGSLGLFLGFSFLDFLMKIITRIEECIIKNKK